MLAHITSSDTATHQLFKHFLQQMGYFATETFQLEQSQRSDKVVFRKDWPKTLKSLLLYGPEQTTQVLI
jgi:hypothetical protein